MAEHTLGPWHTSDPVSCDWEGATFVEVQDATKEQLIAVVYIKRADGHCPSESEGRANAALIATAPELLLALKRARDYIKHMGGSRGHIFDLPGKLEILDKVIAKAEGREEEN